MSSADSTPPWLTLVGIGEDGYPGLGKQARRALLQASRIVGAARQLELLPPCIGAARETWPTPFSLEPLLARRGQPTCVLASGDPMLFGVGASLARQLPATELRVLPAPSSLSLAAARLGWALQEVACLSLVAAPAGGAAGTGPRRPAPAGPEQRRRQPGRHRPPVERPWLRRQSPERAGTPRRAARAPSRRPRRRLSRCRAPPISTWWRWNAAPAPAPYACR
ncbi:precorrin-6y C5,15-methyltransferase (decarboxylating) subunit CbiE [Pseudomonas aeruginosa]|nr:precorrin-6y C5,15-methyltransferase (decarboxylating) subunit CbiE [Pseudomonas aeruginosa]